MPIEMQTSAIPLALIRESPLNHRKHFDEAQLQELAESVKAHGVLQPVLVRPADGGKGKAKYELVYGHRRFRAAQLAGLKAIPATVRELTDVQVLEVALVENCRRQDVRPLEEADAFRALHEEHGIAVEQIAEKVGKSREYVYGRLKLGALKSPAMRKALEAGRVPASTALLVARIPGEKLQEEAAGKILESAYGDLDDDGKPLPMSYRSAADLIEREYMLKLKAAPFDTKDAQLVPAAGDCTTCPKRTGNCAALYPDIKSPDVCTDTVCFGLKKAAAFKQEKAAAKAKGQHLLTEKESRALWDWDGKLGWQGKQKYAELSEKCEADPKKRTFKELLGKNAGVVLARDGKGKLHQLVAREDLPAALAAAGHKFKMKAPEEKPAGHDWKKEQELRALRERVSLRVLQAAAGRVAAGEVTLLAGLRLVALALKHDLADARDDLPRVEPLIAEATSEHQLLALVLEGVFVGDAHNTWNGYGAGTQTLAEAFSIDLKAVEKELRAAPADAAPASDSAAA